MAQPSKPTVLNLQVTGLYTNPSTFGDNVPNGALTVANNVVIDRKSVVASRRGFSNEFSTLTNAGASSMHQYSGTLLIHGDDDTLYADPNNDGNFSAYSGTYAVPQPSDPASRIRGVEASRNFYFLTEAGTYRLDSPSGTPRLAGAPAGLSGTGVVAGDPSGFLPSNTNVAYRVVFGYKDANGTLVLGAPSSRIVVANTGGTSDNVDLTFQVPLEIQSDPTDFFFQVYRSPPSPNLTTEPSDELQLTYEDICTATPTITISDITPDTLLGAALYTNVGQEGIAQANYRPPWAQDICLFKDYTFYANTRTVHTAYITLISAGALNGPDALDVGDTITFTENSLGGASFTLTAAAANNATLGEFAVSNTGSPGYDIQVTASNIALIANQYASNTFLQAYYISLPNELPGKLQFDRLDFNEDSFEIDSSNTACWEQAVPFNSTNNVSPNRVYYSKFSQPEAVPLVNYMEIGSKNLPINRIVPLRDGIMVFKQDGVFRIANAAPPFAQTGIDRNIRILAPNTAAELDNKVYFLSDQGVIAMSDSDGEIVSYVIDRTILQVTSPTLYPNLQATAWGVAYQSDRKYILALPSAGIDDEATQQYVFNHIENVWTRWTLRASCGIVFRLTNKLYLGSLAGSAPDPLDSYVYEERKTFTVQDYVDNQFDLTNTTVGISSVIVVNNPTLPAGQAIAVGDTITQAGTGAKARVTAVTVGMTQTTITLNRQQLWASGTIILWKPIATTVQTIQMDCENPGMNKQFSEIVYMFTEQSFSTLTSRISSDTASVPVLDTLTPQTSGGWGIDPWGTSPWGGSPSGQGKIRRYVPQQMQRAGWIFINLTNAEAFTAFGWSGAQLFFNPTSSRQM